MGQVTRTTYGLSALVLIPNAQVLTLPTADVTLVAGKANTVWIPQFISLALFPHIADYTNLDAGLAFTLRLGGVANVTLDTAFATPGTILAGNDATRLIEQATVALVSDDFTTLVSAALTLHCANGAAGNFTGGNAGNVLKCLVNYSEFTMV